MENKARYTLVGLFIILFLSALIFFILWQAKYSFQDKQHYEYRVYTSSSVAGLNKNSFIEYKGLVVGTVKDIQINPKNLQEIEIVLDIENPTMIREDSYVTIQSQGITGNKNIEIDGGSIDSPALLPQLNDYKTLPLKQSFLDNLTSSAHDITQNINITLSQINKLLSNNNLHHIETLLQSIEESSQKFNTTAQSLNEVLQKDFPNTLHNVDKFAIEWTQLSKDINLLLHNDIEKLIGKVDKTLDDTSNLDTIFMNIETMLEKVNITLDNLNDNGGDMLFKTRDIKYGPQEISNEH